MSNKKLLFFITIGVVIVASIILFIILKGGNTVVTDTTSSLKIWIVGDTTDGYAPIIEGFKKKYPEYKNSDITFEKSSTWRDYHKLVTTTLASTDGPDILVVPAGGDAFLMDKIEPLPEGLIDINSFLQKYASFFIDELMTETTSSGKTVSALYGVPMGYETLGMYYNKSLIPTPPTTWDELDRMIVTDQSSVPLFGLGLGPRYIPEAGDIIAFLSDGVRSFTGLTASNGMNRYMQYAETTSSSTSFANDPYGVNTDTTSIRDYLTYMDEANAERTVYDLLMEGKVGAIFGYPSTVRNLELAQKRAGSNATSDIILTASMPQLSNDSKKQGYLASYWYFAVSSKTQNPVIAGKFMTYLMSEEAESLFLESFPTYIGAQVSFQDGQAETKLSTILPYVLLGNFLVPDAKTYSFDYGIRSDFDSLLHEYMSLSSSQYTGSEIMKKIVTTLQCEIDHLAGKHLEESCGSL